VIWYRRVAQTYQSQWPNSLSLSSLEKDENLLKTIGYFWSDALNCFIFCHGPMTPTHMDVVMITSLYISEVPFQLSSKTDSTSWGAYMSQHAKTKGLVFEKEHTTFLNVWLEHFMFCGPSLASTKNYISLAHRLTRGNPVSRGKLFLGEVYRFLHLTTSSLLSGKKLRTDGPWSFIQLWAHLHFQQCIPNFLVLVNNSFPDGSGRQIRCTSYGQALYSLPGCRLNPRDATSWFKTFFSGSGQPSLVSLI
jgi:hypothetical protein